jgi:serine/threonine-protein kinase
MIIIVLEAGTRLGPYKILTPIGAGGMGEVYRARDVRLDRDVAVKVLSERLVGDPDALLRFEREAKAVAALSHPNILAIHDFNREAETYFTVTELLEGETLRSRITSGPLPWRKAVEIGIAVADGLAAAHSKGIIHRDLKPENIFITGHGQVKILDFGLAEMKPPIASTGEDTPTVDVETEERVVGTVGYMAPEQLRGGAADARSDIFSLGCVLYEMVAGKRPFARESAVDTVAAILREDPTEFDPSRRLPFELQNLIRHCLEKNANERSQSAHDVAFELRTILNVTRTSEAATFRDATTKHPLWIGAVLLFALVLIGVGTYAVMKKSQIRSIAILPFANATGDSSAEYLSDGIAESLIDNLAQLPRLRVMARSTVFYYKSQRVDPRTIGRDLKVDAILTGSLSKEEGNLVISTELVKVSDGSHIWGEIYKRNLTEMLPVQQEISADIVQNLRLRLSGEEQKRLSKRYTENTEAFQLYLKGRYYWNKRNEQGLKQAIDYFQQAIDKDPGYALAYAGLADCFALLGDYAFMPATEAFAKARAAATRALQIDGNLAEAHTSLAHINMYYRDFSNAEKEFRKAIELKPGYSTVHQWYANYLMVQGRKDEALHEIRKALDLDPLSLIINESLGWHLYLSGEYDQAIAQLQKTLELDPNFVPAHYQLGFCEVEKADYEKATQEFQKAVLLSNMQAVYVAGLGYGYAAAGQTQAAENVLKQLEESGTAANFVDPIYVAMIYARLNREEQAMRLLEQAYEQHSEFLVFVNVEPAFRNLRSNPKFEALLRKANLLNH